jgi:hypothetical protein
MSGFWEAEGLALDDVVAAQGAWHDDAGQALERFAHLLVADGELRSALDELLAFDLLRAIRVGEVEIAMGMEERSWGRRDEDGLLLRPGRGSWVCGECPFFATGFEALERHVYEKHLGVETDLVAVPDEEGGA